MGARGRILGSLVVLGVLLAVGVVCDSRNPIEEAPGTSGDVASEEAWPPPDEGAPAYYSEDPLKADLSKSRHMFPAPPTSRVGARRVAAFQDVGYYASYKPVKELRFGELDRALETDTLAFEVHAFAEKKAAEDAAGFAVEHAGELLALALGVQLESMGYTVGLDFEKRVAQPKLLEGVLDLEELGLCVSILGEVEFRIEQSRKEGSYETTARLEGVALFGDAQGEEEGDASFISSVRFQATQTVRGESLEVAAGHPRQAATAALADAVGKILADPELEPALVKFVQKSREAN